MKTILSTTALTIATTISTTSAHAGKKAKTETMPNPKKHLQTEIIINAPAEAIWDTLMDFDRYPEWNPFVTSIQGMATIGEQLTVTLQMENTKPQVFQPKVMKHDQARAFEWKGKLFIRGLFDGHHYFYLEPINDQQTKFVHGEHFSGILRGLIMGMLGDKTQKGFQEMNLALKERVERG